MFPTEHMVRVIDAAHAGKNILNFPVYDGSETGDKVFDTLTVIGREDCARRAQARRRGRRPSRSLPAVPRWPVTISYFEKNKGDNTGEQTPAYSIGFELYENGISRALTLDYNDFVVNGKLSVAGNQRHQAVPVRRALRRERQRLSSFPAARTQAP